MPSYRGVSQADLVKSINDALELIETHSPGPEVQKNIDKLREVNTATGASALGALAAAQDDLQLASAVRGLWKVTGFMSPLYRFHALNDTDGKGLDVYKRLDAWGALSGMRDMAYHKEDGEMDSYLTAQYAKKLAQKLPVVTGLTNIFWSVAAHGRGGLHASHQLNSLVRKARHGADDATLAEAFLKLDIRDRHQVRETAAIACGMDAARGRKLPRTECMSYFGLVMPELGKSLNWGSPEVQELGAKVQEIIEPFMALDEVDRCGVGMIKIQDLDRNGPQGITFGATLRVAQAVKAAFPDMDVIDYTGTPVTLPPAAPAPKPGNMPQP